MGLQVFHIIYNEESSAVIRATKKIYSDNDYDNDVQTEIDEEDEKHEQVAQQSTQQSHQFTVEEIN